MKEILLCLTAQLTNAAASGVVVTSRDGLAENSAISTRLEAF